MKIKLLGIELIPGKGITLQDFFNYIEKSHGTPTEIFGYGRFIYTQSIGKYHAGLLITTKDQKKFVELRKDAKAFKLESKDVTDGSQLADFNFFLISKATGRGIYQYYHNSCALNTFGQILKSHYDALKRESIKTKKGTKELTQKELKEINSNFSGSLKWETIVKPENFLKLISTLKSIKNFTITMSTLELEETVFSPISREAKKASHRFVFSPGSIVKNIRKAIKEFIDSDADIESGRLEGVDENGLQQIIKIINTPDSFGEFDYDTIAAIMNLSPSDFAESPFMAEIIKTAKNNPNLFI